jgi:hypothetical protein
MVPDLEHTLANSYKQDIIQFIINHPEQFDEVIRLAVSDNQPYAWRAAWLLCSCMEDNDIRIRPYIKVISGVLMDRKDGHQSGLLKILYRMELDEEYEAVLFDNCINIWKDINKIPSVRFYALKILIKTGGKYPELSNEISSLIQDYYLESLSCGVRHSIKKLLKGLKKNGMNFTEI